MRVLVVDSAEESHDWRDAKEVVGVGEEAHACYDYSLEMIPLSSSCVKGRQHFQRHLPSPRENMGLLLVRYLKFGVCVFNAYLYIRVEVLVYGGRKPVNRTVARSFVENDVDVIQGWNVD